MGTEDNKAIVRRWVDAVNAADEEAILGLLSEDFSFRTMARSPEWLKYAWGREEIAKVPAAQGTLAEAPITLEIVKLIADGDDVVLEAATDAMLKNGKRYDNAYSLIFSFAGGQIAEIREYSCSHLVVECFGEFNPRNPAASRPGKAIPR